MAPNASVNYYANPELNNLHWPTVKANKEVDERNVKNGYTPLQLLDAPNPHMLSKKDVQVYYKQMNGGEVLVHQGMAKNQCSSVTLSGHKCDNLCVIGIEYCWLHFAIVFHLELKQSTQRDNQGHQSKSLGLFCCGGIEGYTVNNPVFDRMKRFYRCKHKEKALLDS